jgi:hypothetical protein
MLSSVAFWLGIGLVIAGVVILVLPKRSRRGRLLGVVGAGAVAGSSLGFFVNAPAAFRALLSLGGATAGALLIVYVPIGLAIVAPELFELGAWRNEARNRRSRPEGSGGSERD